MTDKGKIADQLVYTLLEQSFSTPVGDELDVCRQQAKNLVAIEGNIAVLSDFQADISYIYVGGFGRLFGLEPGESTIDSAFEEGVFEKIHPDDLLERHILELSFFEMQKRIPSQERQAFSTYCRLRVQNSSGVYVQVIHRTIYLRSFHNGSIWLALCLYSPDTTGGVGQGIDGRVVNAVTGEVIRFERYAQFGKGLISRREMEVLQHLANGMNSGQIAALMHLSVYTVRRHRQNLITKLKVSNTSEAIKTCLFMGITLL